MRPETDLRATITGISAGNSAEKSIVLTAKTRTFQLNSELDDDTWTRPGPLENAALGKTTPSTIF